MFSFGGKSNCFEVHVDYREARHFNFDDYEESYKKHIIYTCNLDRLNYDLDKFAEKKIKDTSRTITKVEVKPIPIVKQHNISFTEVDPLKEALVSELKSESKKGWF